MADNLAHGPNPRFPERVGPVYERKVGPNAPGGRGPLRFEEGLGTDTDLPNNFVTGIQNGYKTPAGRPNHNENVYEKWPEETLRERAHVGSASWVEAPTFLGEFAHGANADLAAVKYEQSVRDGGNYRRINPAEVDD